MNRSARAHRSTKIPNVKLRPAQRESATTTASSSKQHQNKLSRQRGDLLDDREDAAHFRQLRDDGRDQGAHLDADFIGTSARPLKGAVISITGLGDSKSTLTQYARELGARVEGNLTEDVTHLIADRPGSEKYRFALELGMHIVSPNWIVQVRNAWLSGEDVDAEHLEQQHQLPALNNTIICFSALGGSERRTLVALAKALGATVSDELRFDGTITHLVSATADPNASSSVHHLLHFLDRSRHGRNGSREQAAARILAVRPEWLTDCQQAAGCLSEQTYSIFAHLPKQAERESLIQKARTKLPSPFVRKQEPVKLPFQSPFVASSRSQLALAESDPSARDGPQSRSSASRLSDAKHAQDEQEEQPITLGSRQKAAAAAEKSFDNILSQLRSNQPAASANARSSRSHESDAIATAKASTPASASVSTLAPASASSIAPHNPHRNSLLGMSRAASFSPAHLTSTSTAPVSMRKPAHRPVTLPHSSQSTSTQTSNGSGRDGCFHGKSFKVRLQDPHRKRVLEQVLSDNGATLLQSHAATSPHFVVVDPKTPASSLQAIVDAGSAPVLHFWIEYCLHHEFFFEPDEYFAALPARVSLPLPDGDKLKIFLLGFDLESPELYHAHKLIAEMGGSIAKQMKGESLTHVICATKESFDGRRAQRARSCGVPVVGLEFLIKARQTGRMLPPPHPIAMTEPSSSVMTGSTASTGTSSAVTIAHTTDQQDLAGQLEDRLLPLEGCVVSRSRTLTSQSVTLERKVLQLGGCWQAQANDSITHLLHQGTGLPRESKDLGRSAFLIHPTWLDKCIEQSIRVDESLFPASMDPHKLLVTVLSNSDGSACGNFLSQASQSTMQKRPASLVQHSNHQTQADLVAAAKPWHRSISADAAGHADSLVSEPADRMAEERHARGRSEEISTINEDGGDQVATDVDFDADITLSNDLPRPPGIDTEEAPPAPSSQTLIEEEHEEVNAFARDVRGPGLQPVEKQPTDELHQQDVLKPANSMASADEVMELLRSRALAQGARRKSRLPPRARKHRSNEFKISPGSSEGMLPPEKVLEAQEQLDAQRAAEAAALGYSLGMDKDVALPPNSQNGQSFDASVRIVYNDPAAMRERTKLLKMLDHQQPAQSPEAAPHDADELQAEGAEVDDFVGAADAETNASRKRGAEDTFGAARAERHYWENRHSESPTKRPVVRRQPLARR